MAVGGASCRRKRHCVIRQSGFNRSFRHDIVHTNEMNPQGTDIYLRPIGGGIGAQSNGYFAEASVFSDNCHCDAICSEAGRVLALTTSTECRSAVDPVGAL
ncbi:hypothetical protein WNY38_05175 [Pacificibacter sp. AS14]